jgi:MinD-like ATPase involved in chromosome partitioning or flagellar assembly
VSGVTPVCVLVVAAGAAWESEVLAELTARPGVVVLKRCVDVEDLLAVATAGQAHVAVVALDAPGLDATAVDHLRRQHVRPVVVVGGTVATWDQGRLRAHRIGVTTVVAETDLGTLGAVVTDAATDDAPRPVEQTPVGEVGVLDPSATRPEPGRVVVVWGPQGAPGRTTLAAGLAAAVAAAGEDTVLVDADPYGGAIAQHLGVLDEVSGLLSAARLASTGTLVERWVSVPRRLGPHLSVVTGLPRPDRWLEVRAGALEHLVETLRDHANVVVDTGFSLEEDPAGEIGGRASRNALTLGALAVADEIVVVATPDPVGLTRLARGLVDLREVVPATPLRLVLNRHRSGLGWSEGEVRDLVGGFARVTEVHFLPDDRAAADRALLSGRSLVECGDSALGRAVAAVAAAVVPASATGERRGTRRGVRRRRGGRALRR